MIRLEGVRARGHHGVFEHERRDGQDFVVDLVAQLPVGAGGDDEITATLHYGEAAEALVEVLTGEPVDLLETLAERLLDAVERLPGGSACPRLEVTVHKPGAPITVPFTDVSVTAVRERRVPAVVALGANLGDAAGTLAAAVGELGGQPGVDLVGLSPLVQSDPVGGVEQPVYLNAVALVETTLTAPELLAALHRIEARHGRTREVRWGARTLDLDLIQHGDPRAGTEVRCSPEGEGAVGDPPAGLHLPHPRATERAFVLSPWAAVDPAAVLDGRPVAQRAAELDQGGLRPGPPWPPLTTGGRA
ncbi:2-amino-4-hydroxy-6-hydroxymethyldihydropteridine diphosphokinase [Kytococcus sedentarius]|uniref:2-amino-4-hydroxy-6- hydroxymethyldihydropteridine diphosphokinase n=1 Tax=Kytococcus sedentarius TaxID=1276 RepID=UPI0035BC40C1